VRKNGGGEGESWKMESGGGREGEEENERRRVARSELMHAVK